MGKNALSSHAVMDRLRKGIEDCDAERIVGLYDEEAELMIVDRNAPPSVPLIYRGKKEIGEYYTDLCDREITHRVEQEVVGNDRIAFLEACKYLDGIRVLSATVIELRNGRIYHQTVVQAWDE
jgi:hypothetical protein